MTYDIDQTWSSGTGETASTYAVTWSYYASDVTGEVFTTECTGGRMQTRRNRKDRREMWGVIDADGNLHERRGRLAVFTERTRADKYLAKHGSEGVAYICDLRALYDKGLVA